MFNIVHILQASVRCFVRNVANTSTASVSAIPAGRARSAHCGMTSARFRTAMAMGTASAESARACEDTRENTAKKVAHQISNCFPFPVVTGVCIFNLRKLQFKNQTTIEGGRFFFWFMFIFLYHFERDSFTVLTRYVVRKLKCKELCENREANKM